MKMKTGRLIVFCLLFFLVAFFFSRSILQKDNLAKDHPQLSVIGIETYKTDLLSFGEYHCTKNNIYISDLEGKHKKVIYSDKDLKDDIRTIILSPDKKKAIVHFTDPLCGGKDPSYSYNKLLQLDTGKIDDFSTTKDWIDFAWAPDSNHLAYLYKGSLHIVSLEPFKDEEVLPNFYDESVRKTTGSQPYLFWINDKELYVTPDSMKLQKFHIASKALTDIADVRKYNLQISGLFKWDNEPTRSLLSLYRPGDQYYKIEYFDLINQKVIEVMNLAPSDPMQIRPRACIRSKIWSTTGDHLYILLSDGDCFAYDETYVEKNHVYRFTRDTGKTEKLVSFAVWVNPESIHHSQLLYATESEVVIESPIRFKNQTEESERRIWKYQVNNKKLDQLEINPDFINEIQNLNQVSANLFR